MSRPRFISAVLELVVPSVCAGCDMPGASLCVACAGRLPALGATRCLRCGHPWPQDVASCTECPPALAWARYAVPYDDLVARLISALKDGHRRSLVPPLAAIMCARLPAPPAGAVLVPVPSTRARLAERGFNQAALLAAALGGSWGIEVHEVLARDGHGRVRQRGSSRTQRLGQVQGAFRPVSAVPHDAVLVDDVLTTGATLTAAARALRAAGCARVGAVVTARVVLARGVTRVG